MRISVWGNLEDSYLKAVTQLGADCLDFGSGNSFPGVVEQGYPDLDELLKIKNKIHSYGLEINRVTLPDITEAFMNGTDEGEIELENTCNALKVFAEAGAPIARQRFAGDTFNDHTPPFSGTPPRPLPVAGRQPWTAAPQARVADSGGSGRVVEALLPHLRGPRSHRR